MLEAKQSRTQAERREEAERRIVQAAIRLVVEKGYDRFSLADVGDLAGYSRGLPGHYFGKKEDLLSHAATYIVRSYIDAAIETEAFEPGIPRLVANIRRYVRGVGSWPNRALSVLVAEARFRPGLKRTITELNVRAREGWQAFVQAGIDSGNIRADVNAVGMGSIVHAFLRGQSALVGTDPTYDVTATTEEFIRALEALLTPIPSPKSARRKL